MRDGVTRGFVVEMAVGLGGTTVVDDGDNHVADTVVAEVATVKVEMVPTGVGTVEWAFIDEDEVGGVGEF